MLSKSIKADEVVSIQNGCCVEESKSGSLLEQISNGDYDSICQLALKK
jgi:ABC-type transport system involved in Fe-S cluster assembly fused permease/ATPase subunit